MEGTAGQSLQGCPTLHHLSSSQSLRILWALEELAAHNGQHYTLKTYKRHMGRAPAELKSVFPLGKSPILVVDPDLAAPKQQPSVVTESRLILQYLSDNYAQGNWEPIDLPDKVRDEYFQEFANNTLAMKVNFVMVFDIIPSHSPWFVRPLVSGMFNFVAAHYKNDLVAPFELMEAALSDQSPWFAGQKLGLADFCMSWPMDLASQRGYFDGKQYPKVADWHRRVCERPAYKAALAKGGSYNLVTFDF